MIKNYLNNNTDKLKYYKNDNFTLYINLILQRLSYFQYPIVLDNICSFILKNKFLDLKTLNVCLEFMIKSKQIEKNANYYNIYRVYNKAFFVGKIELQKDKSSIVIIKKQCQYVISLSKTQTKSVFHGDIVAVSILGLNKKYYLDANIESIIQRNTTVISGYYFYNLDVHFIQPINKNMPKRILIVKPKIVIDVNTLIKVNVIIQPSRYNLAVAIFHSVLKKSCSVRTAISLVLNKYSFYNHWPKQVLNISNKLPTVINDQDLIGRTDLRHLSFFTIDDYDAKDFDDAIYVYKINCNCWKLYVAISDVSYYVSPNSFLDHEAQKRSSSIYFPSHVIPMLPEQLSNGICSLISNVDRLVMICEIDINNNAKLLNYKFYPGVINSKAKLTYDDVNKLFLYKDNIISLNYPDIVVNLFDLFNLYQTLLIQRKKRGAINFNNIETKCILNKDLHVTSIIPCYRNHAHYAIEECMLLVNSVAAKFIISHNAIAPFRVHESPSLSKAKNLELYLKTLSINCEFNYDHLKSVDYANILEGSSHLCNFDCIQSMILQSMQQAIYSVNNKGHFGLAYDAYVHFTSPIRRYPDLVTHRIIKFLLNKNLLGSYYYNNVKLEKLSNYASLQERNIDSMVNDVIKFLHCHFLNKDIGNTFDAIITNCMAFGIFVRLIDNYISGLVHISLLSDDYCFDKHQYKFVSKKLNKSYKLGQKVKVRLLKIDFKKLYIDFVFVDLKLQRL